MKKVLIGIALAGLTAGTALAAEIDVKTLVQTFSAYELGGITKMGLRRVPDVRNDIQPALLTRHNMDLTMPLNRGVIDAKAGADMLKTGAFVDGDYVAKASMFPGAGATARRIIT